MAAATQYASVPGIDRPACHVRDCREGEAGGELLSWLGGQGGGVRALHQGYHCAVVCKAQVQEFAEELGLLDKSVRKTGHIEGSNMQVWDLSRQLERRQIVGKDGDSSDIKVTVKKKFSHGHQVVQWREKQKMSMAR